MVPDSYDFVEERFPRFRRSDGVDHRLVPAPCCIKCYKPVRPEFAGASCYNCHTNGPVDGQELRRIVAGTVYIPKVVDYAHSEELLELKRSGKYAQVYAEVLQHVLAVERIADYGLVVPVPSSRAGGVGVGPASLARRLAALVGKPYREALAWARPVQAQKGLRKEARAENVEGAMNAAAAVKGRLVLAVDDVSTSGRTLREAGRAVSAAGGLGVIGAVGGRDYPLDDLVFVGALKKRGE